MNKKQYNNIINWVLKHNTQARSEDSLEAIRTICKELGVAIPNGTTKEVADILATNNYMYWSPCTARQAQETANDGTPAIGVNAQRIILLAAADEEQPVANTASVMTLSDKTPAYTVANLSYYAYSGDLNICYFQVWNEIVFNYLDALHQLARQYDSSNQMELTLQFIRRNSYNNENWNIVAGEINNEFVKYVKDSNKDIYDFFTTEALIIYDHDNAPVDFLHLSATMNAIIVGGDIYWKSLIIGPTHVRNLVGWAGDLQALVVDTYVLTNASDDYNEFYNAVYEMMGSKQYSFSTKDLLADVDAFNFAINWISNYFQFVLFGSACRYYYTNRAIPGTQWISSSNFRFNQFVGSNTKPVFSNIVAAYTKQNWSSDVQWPLYESYATKKYGITLHLTDNQSNAARDAFTDFVWGKYQSEQFISNA